MAKADIITLGLQLTATKDWRDDIPLQSAYSLDRKVNGNRSEIAKIPRWKLGTLYRHLAYYHIDIFPVDQGIFFISTGHAVSSKTHNCLTLRHIIVSDIQV